MVQVRHSIETSIERLSKAARAAFGVDINYDPLPHKRDPLAIGSADHPISGRRANVVVKGDVILINDFRTEPFSIRLDRQVESEQNAETATSKLVNLAATSGPSLSDFQAFQDLANISFPVADEAVVHAISAKRSWTPDFTQTLAKRGLIRPVRLRMVPGEDKDFHSIACEALLVHNSLPASVQKAIVGNVSHYGLFVGGLHSLYRMGYVVSYSPMTLALRKMVSSLELRGINEDLIDPEEGAGTRVTNVLALPHNYVNHKYVSAPQPGNKLFVVEAAAKAFTLMNALSSDVVALNSFSDFLKLVHNADALETLSMYAANKQRVIVVLDPVEAADRNEQRQYSTRLANALRSAGIAASILVSTHKSVDDQLAAGTHKQSNVAALLRAGLSEDEAQLLSFCKPLETTETAIDYANLTGSTIEDWLSSAASAHHDPKARAKALDIPLQTITSLEDVAVRNQDGSFLYVRDVSGTGVGKSHNAAEVAIAAATGKLGRKHKLSQLMQDHRILYTVGTYDTIPAAFIGNEAVRIVRGRTNVSKVVVETANGKVLMDKAEADSVQGRIVAELPGNCENFEGYEKVRKFKTAEQANSDAASFCRGCDKRANCQYIKDQRDLRSGAMPERVVVTANANRVNVVEALASAGTPLKPVKLVMIDDDLNLLRDTEELSLKQLVNSFVSMDANTLEGAVADAFRSVLNEMEYKVRPFTVLPKEMPEGVELLEPVAGVPDVLDAGWLKTVQGNRDNVHMMLNLDSQDYFMTGVAKHLLSRGVTHEAIKSMDPDLIREALPAMILPNCKELDRMQPAIQAMLDPAMQNLAKLSYVAEYFNVSEVKLPVIKTGQREEVAKQVRKALGPNVSESSVQFQREVHERLQASVTEYLTATEYSFRNVDIRILFSRTDPSLFRRHAAAVVQLSADESWNSHQVYGKLPDVLVERHNLRSERPVAVVVGGFHDRPFRANESSRASAHFAMAELVGVTAAKRAGVKVPAELRSAIFADKRIKDGVAQKIDSDATFQQYFGDEVGKNRLFNQNINTVLAFPQKNLNLGVANLTTGISTIDKIELHEGLDGKSIWSTADFSNVYERSIQLNQTYGRLRANRRNDDSLFVAFGDEVFLDNERFDVRRVQNPFEFEFASVFEGNEGLAMAYSADARKAVEATYAILQSELEAGTIADWVAELAGIAGKSWINEHLFGYLSTGKREMVARPALLLAAIKSIAWHVSSNGDRWNYQSFAPLLSSVDASAMVEVLSLLSANAEVLKPVFSAVADAEYTYEVELRLPANCADGVSDPVVQPTAGGENGFASSPASFGILVEPPYASGVEGQMLKSSEPNIKGMPEILVVPQFNHPSPSPQRGMQLCSGNKPMPVITASFEQIKQDPYFHQVIGDRVIMDALLTRHELMEVVVRAEMHRANGEVSACNYLPDRVRLQVSFPESAIFSEGWVNDAIQNETDLQRMEHGLLIGSLDIPVEEELAVTGWLFRGLRGRKALARFAERMRQSDVLAYRALCRQFGSDLIYCIDRDDLRSSLAFAERFSAAIQRQGTSLLAALAIRMCC